jgi:hypothetical protein
MNVDQSGRNNLIFNIDQCRAVGWEVGANRIDDAATHAHVEGAIAAARRIDQSAAF